MRRACDLDPTSLDEMRRLGSVFFHKGDYEAALVQLRQVVDINAHDKFARQQAGLSCFFLERFAEAATDLRAYLQLCPDDFGCHRVLALALFKLDRVAEGVQALRDAARLRPHSSDVYREMGEALLKLRHYDQAIVAWERAHQLDPTDRKVMFLLAALHTRIGRPRRARELYDELRAVDAELAAKLIHDFREERRAH